MMRFRIASCCAAAMAALVLVNTARAQSARFGLSEQKGAYVVDTGAGLIFAISRGNGDLISMKYKGRECEAQMSEGKRYSHYASGLSGGSKITAEKDPGDNWIKISIDDEKIGVTQYYIARRGESNIYMATYAEKLPPPGEMRFITYLNRDVFTHLPSPSDISQSDGGVEGKDVFKNSKTGTTYSKFYNATDIIDGGVHGVSGNGIACFMNMGNRETSSGGPFFRDIENQSGSGAAEFYNYMYSGHTQTEPFRPGLKGPYALQFTDGEPPTPPDYSFIEQLHLKGYVPPSGRGALTGRGAGVPSGNRATVALSNASAQYWANPDDDGTYTIKNALPGTYTETLYDVELAVAKTTVTIEAGETTKADIVATLLIPPAIFRIGMWDGTPRGFLNADKIADHHPSDVCMTPFTNGNFIVGKSRELDWPLGEWKDVNNDQRITFTLTPEQAETPLTLRIGITWAFNDGRPQIEVNAQTPQARKSALPAPSNQPKQSRRITRGTYRGNNDIFPFDIPQGSLHSGTNTIDIHIDGSKKSYPGFLSPNVVFDAIDLVTTADARRATATLPAKSPAVNTEGSD
jgi:rhamnogalacturonan endolyase